MIFLLDQWLGWSIYLKSADNWHALTKQVEKSFFYATLLYLLLTIIGCVVLALPGITFAIVAALLFGPWIGTLVCLIATTLGALVSFLAGRYFLKDSLKPLIIKNRYLSKMLFEQDRHHDIMLLMITRLLPVFPYNLQNFAYGITDINIITYLICTFIFMFPGVALFTFGTAGISHPNQRVIYLSITVLIASVLVIIIKIISSRYLRLKSN